MVFIVRKGNPKNIHDWDDLIRPDVAVITPNPKTSGAARWNYMAAWAWADRKFRGDETRIQDFMVRLFQNVPILDSGARGASNTFTQNKIGDVLINWENEAFLLVEDVGIGEYDIIVPSVSILAEPPVAILDVNSLRHGTVKVAEAYLDSLYSLEVQQMVGRHHYRPRHPEAMLQFGDKYPEIDLITVEEFGGWRQAQQEHFNDGGVFDELMRIVRERAR